MFSNKILCFVDEEEIVESSILPLSENEVELAFYGILKKMTFNGTSRLEKLRFQSRWKSKISILLYRMVSLTILHPF
jgi:hypothetical protein